MRYRSWLLSSWDRGLNPAEDMGVCPRLFIVIHSSPYHRRYYSLDTAKASQNKLPKSTINAVYFARKLQDHFKTHCSFMWFPSAIVVFHLHSLQFVGRGTRNSLSDSIFLSCVLRVVVCTHHHLQTIRRHKSIGVRSGKLGGQAIGPPWQIHRPRMCWPMQSRTFC
jgi:hypothetical protein